jgi:hypothetical protein
MAEEFGCEAGIAVLDLDDAGGGVSKPMRVSPAISLPVRGGNRLPPVGRRGCQPYRRRINRSRCAGRERCKR